MMTVQSDRYTKPVFSVFLGFLLTVFDFGFFQEPPQPICTPTKYAHYIINNCFYFKRTLV